MTHAKSQAPCLLISALLAAAAILPTPATASRLAVSPTRVTISGEAVASVTLRNRSTDEVLVQARVVEWKQAGERDEYLQTDEILISPPIIKLSPDSDQIIRIAHAGERAAQSEKTYRLILSEVVADRSTAPEVAIQFAIEFNLPIFVLPSGPRVQPELGWAIMPDSTGQLRLEVTNTGTAHAQVRSINLTCEAKQESFVVASIHRGRYVLPGSSVSWPVQLDEDAPCAQISESEVRPGAVVYYGDGYIDPVTEGGALVGHVSESIDVSPTEGGARTTLRKLSVRANTDFGVSRGQVSVLTVSPAVIGTLQ